MVLSREYSAATKQLLNDKGLKCVCELCDCGWVFSGNLYSSACLHADGQKYPNRKLKSKASCKLKDLLLLRSKIEMPRSKLKFRTRFFKYSLPGYGPCVNNTLCNTRTNFNKIPHECHKICIKSLIALLNGFPENSSLAFMFDTSVLCLKTSRNCLESSFSFTHLWWGVGEMSVDRGKAARSSNIS